VPRRRAAQPAAPARGAPVIKLEDSSEDDWYQPTPPRLGDPGQGSSRWAPGQSSQQAPPPQDGGESSDDDDGDSSDDDGDSSDDDGGDYTAFYRHLGM
jgi:hypothetical protein